MSKSPIPPINTHNLFTDLPDAGTDEQTEIFLNKPNVRIERIVSEGQSSPAGIWYDQHETEWVVVLKGAARLQIEGEANERDLRPGDAVLLPAHIRHRVTWTDPLLPTVWLAVFVEE